MLLLLLTFSKTSNFFVVGIAFQSAVLINLSIFFDLCSTGIKFTMKLLEWVRMVMK